MNAKHSAYREQAQFSHTATHEVSVGNFYIRLRSRSALALKGEVEKRAPTLKNPFGCRGILKDPFESRGTVFCLMSYIRPTLE